MEYLEWFAEEAVRINGRMCPAANGDPLDYLSHAVKTGRLVVAADLDDAKDALVADWWQHGERDPSSNVMIALRRADVADLNTAGQEMMERTGRRGRERIVVGDVELAAGDRIICRRNSVTLGACNGTRATVLEVDERARAITIRTNREDTLTLPASYLDEGHVQLGYAMTGHSSSEPDRRASLRPGPRTRRAAEVGLRSPLTRPDPHLRHRSRTRDRRARPDHNRPDGLDRLARALVTPAARPLAHAIDRDLSIGPGL